MSTADEIEQEAVTAAWTQFQRMPSSNPSDYAHAVRLAIMPLVRRAQAEALREAADSDEVLAHYVDTESRDFNRGVDHGADEVFDRLIQRADRTSNRRQEHD